MDQTRNYVTLISDVQFFTFCADTATHTQTHRGTDAQTHRHTDGQTHRRTDTQTHTHAHPHTRTDAQTHRGTDAGKTIPVLHNIYERTFILVF